MKKQTKKERRYFWVERMLDGRITWIDYIKPKLWIVDYGKSIGATIKRELWERVGK